MFLGGLVAALLDNTVRGNVLCKLLRKKCYPYSPYLCFILLLYFDLYILGDDALIS